MSRGYWKLVEEADGWDIQQDKYEWVEEGEETDRYGRTKTVEKGTGRYSYKTPKWIKETKGW